MDHDLVVVVEIARAPHEVRAWWTEFPAEYRAADPREEPHRIVTLRRTGSEVELLTYWRGPFGRVVEVPETMRLKVDGDFSVDVTLPFGLAQRDEFTLDPTRDGTRVTIRVAIWPRAWYGRLTRPFFLRFARRSYPRTWRAAARLCERDAPKLVLGEA